VNAASAADVCRHTGLGKFAVQNVHAALLRVESDAGQRASEQLKVSGDLEADATALRKTFVGHNNKDYKEEVALAKKRGSVGTVYSLHLRVLGLCQRGGPLLLKILPHKLIKKGARPSPESTDEVMKSSILQHIKKRRSSVLFTDGAAAWPAALKKSKLSGVTCQQVRHKRGEFVKRVATSRSHSSLAGTQSLDARWKSLCDAIPTNVPTRPNRATSSRLFQYMWSWLWRHNMDVNADLLTELGKISAVTRA
jgi:hypothetical protein